MTRERKHLTGAPLRASVEREIKRGPSARSFSARAKDHALEALEVLSTLTKEASSESVRVSAANALLDRAYGKPISGARTAAGGKTSSEPLDGVEVRWLDDPES